MSRARELIESVVAGVEPHDVLAEAAKPQAWTWETINDVLHKQFGWAPKRLLKLMQSLPRGKGRPITWEQLNRALSQEIDPARIVKVLFAMKKVPGVSLDEAKSKRASLTLEPESIWDEDADLEQTHRVATWACRRFKAEITSSDWDEGRHELRKKDGSDWKPAEVKAIERELGDGYSADLWESIDEAPSARRRSDPAKDLLAAMPANMQSQLRSLLSGMMETAAGLEMNDAKAARAIGTLAERLARQA